MSDGLELSLLDWREAEALALPLREQFFVVEQCVPLELERDEFDPVCRHALLRLADGRVVATGRLLPDGHIGRMAVAAKWRCRGLGGRVLEALVAEARRQGFEAAVLNAQVQAEPFYAAHGFAAEGEVFMDAGIPHRTMRRRLSG